MSLLKSYLYLTVSLLLIFGYTSQDQAATGLLKTLALNQPKKHCYSYLLRVQFPASIKQPPILRGYYKGSSLEFQNDYCIIPENKECTQFTLFVTSPENTPRPKAVRNNIKYLERLNDKCRLFYITRDALQENSRWCVKEEDTKNMPSRIPDDATILLMHPDSIDMLKDDTDPKIVESAEKFSAINVIALPKIIVKSTLTQADFDTITDEGALASIDLKAINSALPKEVKIDTTGAVLITMQLPR